MTTASRPFELPTPADASRLWFMDLIHAPRALPPLSADLNDQSTEDSPLGMDALTVNGYSYRSPRTMGPPPGGIPAALPAGEALKNWHERFLPACQQVHARFRDQDYASMSPDEILEFVEQVRPAAQQAFFDTIVSAMQLQPDAERLSSFLEARLGPEAELVAATILHGSGSQTRSLGDEVAELARQAESTPAALAALRARDYAAAADVGDEPWASALGQFLQDHEDEIALWSEIHVPPWNVDPAPLMRLVGATLAAGAQARVDAGAASAAAVRERLAPEDVAEFEAALALSRDYVPIIEHRARWQLKMVGGLRRAYAAFGQKLVDAGHTDAVDDVFFLHLGELSKAARGELDARALVSARRTEWQANLALTPPLTLGLPVPVEVIGAMNPMMRRMFGAVALPAPTATEVVGIAASGGVVTGRARVVGGLAEADELEDGDILVCPSTSPPWTPYFAIVAAVVTDAGGVVSHAAIEAREYGIPAVVGTRQGTRLIPDGARITVDGTAGTVTILG